MEIMQIIQIMRLRNKSHELILLPEKLVSKLVIPWHVDIKNISHEKYISTIYISLFLIKAFNLKTFRVLLNTI